MRTLKQLVPNRKDGGRQIAGVLAILLCASIGTYLLSISRASTPAASVESEKGTISGPASTSVDSSASGGHAVKFGLGGSGSNPTGNFYTVGKDIVDPSGNKFFPVGANVGVKYNFDYAGVADGQSDAALAWGWNTIRLNIYCSTDHPWTSSSRFGSQYLLDQVDQIVQEYTAKHIVVMVECHDFTKNGPDFNLPFNDPTNYPANAALAPYVTETDQFWHNMALKYKDNPYVWFNALNEFGKYDNANWLTANQRYLNIVRSAGAENIFVSEVMNSGNDAGWTDSTGHTAMKIYATSPTYPNGLGHALNTGQCNVLFSMHNYGGLAAATPGPNGTYFVNEQPFKDYWTNVQAANLPMIIGEYGLDYRASLVPQSNGTVQIVNDSAETVYHHFAIGEYANIHDAPSFGIGSLMWHATFTDPNRLANPITSKPSFYSILNSSQSGISSSYTFTQLGQDLWDLGHNHPNLGAFTGNYAASNCASAQ